MRVILSGLLVLGICASGASAAFLSDYFDYGANTVTLEGLDGGSGWANPWVRQAGYGGDIDYTDYHATPNLSSSVAGYLNTGNMGGSAYGASRGDRATWRETGGLDGTIWMSLLMRFDNAFDAGHTKFTFDAAKSGSSGVNNYFSLRSGNAGNPPQNFGYNGVLSTIPASTFNFNVGQTYLVMARITLNDNDANDRVEIWTHAGNASSVAALGAPDFNQATADVFGDSLDYFGVEIRGTPVDAIRISNDPTNGFAFVTTGTVPEPTTLALAAFGGLGMLLRRRPKRAGRQR